MYKSLNKFFLGAFTFTLMISSSTVFAQNEGEPIKRYLDEKLKNFNPKDYYKPDTDGDGIIDIYDREPNKYNITDRDLRFFMKLAYRPQDEIERIFAGDKAEIKKFNKEQLLGAADIREITKNWKFVIQVNNNNGFSASVFSIGKQVVVAFRGTDGGKDVIDDIRLFFRLPPWQAYTALTMENYIKDYDDIYLTGHSLGGYLAQYFLGAKLYEDDRFRHSALFNSPGVRLSWPNKKIERISNLTLNNPYAANADKRHPIDYPKGEFKAQPFSLNGDPVSLVNRMPNIQWFENVDGLNAHKSSNFFGVKQNDKYREWFSTGDRLDTPYLDLDTDGDGIKDVDELRIGTDYTKEDTDGDGYSDKLELVAGSDPNNPNSTPENVDFIKSPSMNGVQLPTNVIVSTVHPNREQLPDSKNGFIKMESNDKPFVITRLSTDERNKIENPIEGMLIWNTTKQCLELYKDFGKGLEWGCIKQGVNRQ